MEGSPFAMSCLHSLRRYCPDQVLWVDVGDHTFMVKHILSAWFPKLPRCY